jgi:hypothetical protein
MGFADGGFEEGVRSLIEYSFLLLAQKKRTKEKGSLKSFLGLTFYRLPTQYNSSSAKWRTPQTVLLTYSQRFAANKMLLFFQKRFGGIARLAAIWFLLVFRQ